MSIAFLFADQNWNWGNFNLTFLLNKMIYSALVGLTVGSTNEDHHHQVNVTTSFSPLSKLSYWWTNNKSQLQEDNNRNLWLNRNGERTTSQEEEILYQLHPGGAEHSQNETDKSLSVLKNLVHPEEELQDEINDRQIIQAVVSSMAEWNLRKLQKLRRSKNKTASLMR